MTDKEILQGIDKLEDGIPFDEIRNGDKWLDIHELFSEIRERIRYWHYPSKGELPEEAGQYFCRVRNSYGDKWYEVVLFIADWVLKEDEQVIAWQYIEPPKEEA